MFNTIFVPGSFEICGQTHTRGNVMEQQPDRTRTISKYQQHHDLRSTYNNNNDNDNDNDNNNNNKYIIYIYADASTIQFVFVFTGRWGFRTYPI
jgi:hypothetical protein